MGCDKAHDQSWTNYFVPMQLAAIRKLYKKTAKETVHWLVYEPAYIDRWVDDSTITSIESAQSDGYWLHSIRLKAAKNVTKKGAKNYLDRIKQVANSHGITYKGISSPNEFWAYLSGLPGNISRVWYSGHASSNGLMLSLTHNSYCEAVANSSDMLYFASISVRKSLKSKFSGNAVSKFYGCYTSKFAEEWAKTFSVKAEGAVNKVDFGVIDRPSSIANVLERIEQTPTSTGKPDWRAY